MAMIVCTECGKNFSDKAPACPNCGCPTSAIQQNNEAKELITGFGRIIAHDTYVELIPLDFRALGKVNRNIYYKNISAISYQPPSFINPGFIQFIISGAPAKKVDILKYGWDKELAKDENSILIRYSINKKFKQECLDFVNYLNTRIN